jgi:hypothetical protein
VAEAVSWANSTLSGNSARGGDAGTATVEAGSAYGGGVAHWSSGVSTFAFINCTFSGNSAQAGQGYDGSLAGGAEGGSLRGGNGLMLNYCTVVASQALGQNALGGLRSYAEWAAARCCKPASWPATAAPNANGPDLGQCAVPDYNLIQNPNGYTLGGTTTNNIIGLDPVLGPLQDNGGPTLTHALLRAARSSTGLPVVKGCGTTVAEDQRGVPRPQDLACDSGAYELIKTGQLELVKRVEPWTTRAGSDADRRNHGRPAWPMVTRPAR